eukprot:CAMPEP_0184334762 /NCGR_PEP_ID=MMETSP1089-20130417/3432_1 /TAXON_ID=38269 ORGANISM="Gloeochaete wittrockiana, Strain SAG46.84" /NCGR_SAMPLE_ID=MMETSP1089 /ASSEMBLY_ACC=CAM_ASM_000445 /LENGTH=72 /DNA_ID=CAMNT_0026659103 /DNA_START=27 /DNA_END=245 /DNA_ORIENTATION=+
MSGGVHAMRGILLTCDIPTMQYVKHLNKEKSFIIHELDETHVFVDASVTNFLHDKLDALMDENTYQAQSERT